MMQLTPFKINTSKKSCHFRIALILNDFKPTRINTSTISTSKPPRINTSERHGGRGGRVFAATGNLCQGTASAVPKMPHNQRGFSR